MKLTRITGISSMLILLLMAVRLSAQDLPKDHPEWD
jgi:hypothetical protein